MKKNPPGGVAKKTGLQGLKSVEEHRKSNQKRISLQLLPGDKQKILSLPIFGLNSLSSAQNNQPAPNPNRVDLSEFHLWQTALQRPGQTTKIGHSTLCERFVLSMQGCEKQSDQLRVTEFVSTATGPLDRHCIPTEKKAIDRTVVEKRPKPKIPVEIVKAPAKRRKKGAAVKVKPASPVVVEQPAERFENLRDKYWSAERQARVPNLISKIESLLMAREPLPDLQIVPEREDSLQMLGSQELSPQMSEETAVKFLFERPARPSVQLEFNFAPETQKPASDLSVDLGFDFSPEPENLERTKSDPKVDLGFDFLQPVVAEKQKPVSVSRVDLGFDFGPETQKPMNELNENGGIDTDKPNVEEEEEDDDDVIPPSPHAFAGRQIALKSRKVPEVAKENSTLRESQDWDSPVFGANALPPPVRHGHPFVKKKIEFG